MNQGEESMKQGRQAVKQGKTVLIFTLVTVSFASQCCGVGNEKKALSTNRTYSSHYLFSRLCLR